MKLKAKLNYLRIAPRKVRLVAALIRKKEIGEARTILNFTVKRASYPLLKLLNSAAANAKNNFQLDENNLYVSKITVDGGPINKRWRMRSRGRAARIQKKTSKITLILEEIKTAGEKKDSFRKTSEFKAVGKTAKETKEKRKSAPKMAKPAAKEEIKKGKTENEKRKEKAEFKKIKPESGRKIIKPALTGRIKRIFRRKSF